MPTLIADRRLYVTENRERVVEEGDPAAAFLLAGEGCRIHSDDVAAHDLAWKDGEVVYPGYGSEVKQQPPPENKMAPKPEDKAAEGQEEADEGPEEEWGLQTSPEDYLEKYPDGPNAELARQILGREDEGEE